MVSLAPSEVGELCPQAIRIDANHLPCGNKLELEISARRVLYIGTLGP